MGRGGSSGCGGVGLADSSSMITNKRMEKTERKELQWQKMNVSKMHKHKRGGKGEYSAKSSLGHGPNSKELHYRC